MNIHEIKNQIELADAPMKSFMRGNAVPMKDVSNSAMERAQFITRNRGEIAAVLNAAGDNTIATELKRNVILQTVVKDFARRVIALDAFSTVFQPVPLQGTDKVEVPFLDLDSSTTQVFAKATGYQTIGETELKTREIVVGTDATNGGRWYQGLSFTSEEFNRQPFLKVEEFARMKADKLASDVVADVLSCITAANFGPAAITESAAAFDSDDLTALVEACKLWPEAGRSLFVDTTFHVSLLKDASFKAAYAAGSAAAIQEGRLHPRVLGFDYVEVPTIPGNSENLVGFAAFKSAVLVAFAPVPPCQEVRQAGCTYQIYVDPATGVVLEYRSYGNNVLDTATHIIESSFGWAAGNTYSAANPVRPGAIKRIVSP